MEHKLAQLLAAVAEDNGMEASLYENYSGRGMYGETTSGIVLSEASDLTTLMYNGASAISRAIEDGSLPPEIGQIRHDSMGCDVIFY